MDFFRDILEFSFLRYSLIGTILCSVTCGIVGGYVVVRRNTYMAGAVSHSLLGGIGAAIFAQYLTGWQWLTPTIGALVAAVGAAIVITYLSQRCNVREDTALSAIWALGMALGVSFIMAVPGYPPDLNGFLFGNILLVTPWDIWMTAILDVAILVCALLFHKRFVTFCFNPELLVLRRINTFGIALTLNLMTALTVVILSQLAGLILCIALLVLPAATASLLARRLSGIMVVGGLLCLAASLLGLMLSYSPLPNGVTLAAGPTIVEISGLIFLAALAIKRLRRTRRK